LLSGIKVVLFFVIASALLGFTQVPIAEGAVSWNGFLREIGIGGPQVYEVSQTVVVLTGENTSPPFSLRCLDGDWMNFFERFSDFGPEVFVTNPPGLPISVSAQNVILDGGSNSRLVGVGLTSFGALQAFDYEVTATILCLSPSQFANAIGGDWQATDTTALIIGYSVLNAYWLAPIGIGIGLGIYLVKRKI